MADPFDVAMGTLLTSATSERVSYEHVVQQEIKEDVPALCRPPIVEGDFDQVRLSADVRQFEIAGTALDHPPARGDKITQVGGNVYVVQQAPHNDQLEIFWVLDCYRA